MSEIKCQRYIHQVGQVVIHTGRTFIKFMGAKTNRCDIAITVDFCFEDHDLTF